MKNFFFKKHCAICKKTSKIGEIYFNDDGVKIFVCSLCYEYAERRAYRKMK